MIKILRQSKTCSGITLIETVLYLALFSILMVTALPLLMNVERVQSEQTFSADSTEQYLFVEAKIRNVIQTAHVIVTPAPGELSSRLVVESETGDRSAVYIRDSRLDFEHGPDNIFEPLTASDTKITSFQFSRTPNSENVPSVSLHFSLNDYNFGTTTYFIR